MSDIVKKTVLKLFSVEKQQYGRILHALWYIRVFGSNPVLDNKGIFGVFEYSIPLRPPL